MSCPAGPSPLIGPQAIWQRMFCVMRQSARDVTVSAMTGGATIGSLRFNDFFRWEGDGFVSGAYHRVVLVRNDFTGALQWGSVNFADILNSGEVFSPVYNFPRTNFTWNGMNLREYAIWNRPAALRSRDGVLIETLPVGTRIGVGPTLGDAVMGQDWCTFWRVATVVRSPGGVVQWTWANMNPNEHAFVDVGLPNDRPTTSTIRTSLA